jgi:hypothetical protein
VELGLLCPVKYIQEYDFVECNSIEVPSRAHPKIRCNKGALGFTVRYERLRNLLMTYAGDDEGMCCKNNHNNT